MAARLRIDVAQGILDVEGTEEFVQSIYGDLRENLLSQFGRQHPRTPETDSPPSTQGHLDPAANLARKPTRRRPAKKHADADTNRTSEYAPKLDKAVDLSGLAEFFRQFQPKNHPEKILIFAKYLTSSGHDPCTADQIFTCYSVLKERIPKAFLQAIRDTHGKRAGFIDYQSPTHIEVTHIGENHFNLDLKRTDTGDTS